MSIISIEDVQNLLKKSKLDSNYISAMFVRSNFYNPDTWSEYIQLLYPNISKTDSEDLFKLLNDHEH